MSVFRPRYVFRDDLSTRLLGGASIVSASLSAVAVVLAVTVSGSTPVSSASTTQDVVVAVDPISSANLEVSIALPVVLTTTTSGISVSPVTVNAATVFTVTPLVDALVSAPIVISSTATVGSIFTQNVTAAVVMAATPAPQVGALLAVPVVIQTTLGVPEISGGVVTTATTATVAWTSSSTGSYGATNNVPDQFYFETIYNAALNAVYVSSVAVIKGISVPSLSVVANGEQRVNGGAFTTAPVFVEVDDELELSHTSATTPSTQTVTTAIIGGVTGRFVSVTAAERRIPIPWRHRFHKPRRRT